MTPVKILLIVASSVVLSSLVADSYAAEQNGVITTTFTENPPFVDGKWTTPDEWEDASVTTVNSGEHRMILLVKHDRNFLYVMGNVVTDYASPTGTNLPEYVTALHFDTKNDGGIERQIDDFRFVFGKVALLGTGVVVDKCTSCVINAADASGFNTDTNKCEKGTMIGSSESSASTLNRNWVWFSSEKARGSQNAYSCEKPPTDLKSASTPTGAKVNIIDYGTGSGVYQEVSTPSQFNYAIGFSSTNDPYESGRDHRVFEYKIPLDFLHKSDSYGFGVIYWTRAGSNMDAMVWPSNLDWQVPSTYGSLMAEQKSITMPPVPVLAVSEKSLSFGNTQVSDKSSKNIKITNTGTGLLKISSVRGSGEFSISGIDTSVIIQPGQSTSFTLIFSPLSTGEKSGLITISSNDLSNPSYAISASGKAVEKGSSPIPTGNGCLIATAAFGSELSPQVQLLREVRDNVLLSTSSGTGFMSAFNAVYYSFSPTVADWERDNPVFKEVVKTTITPMLSTLSILNYVDIDSEQEMLGYGIGIILLNVGIYFMVPVLVIIKLKKKLW